MTDEERRVFEELRFAAGELIRHQGRSLADPRMIEAVPACVKACNAAERILDPLRSTKERALIEAGKRISEAP